MSSLQVFLQPILAENEKVVISERFVENGKPVPFEIRPLTQDENDEIYKRHRKKDKKGNEIFDYTAYAYDLTVSAVVFPDLNDTQLQKHYGVLGSISLIKKMLLAGEFNRLAQEVRRISKLDEDINEEIEDVKNE